MNGILLVDKPEGWTSYDVAAKVKRLCRTSRVGHSGTLDPLATGLLVVFAGRATRAVSFCEGHDKRYTAALRLGLVTDTKDITGRIVSERGADVSDEELERALEAFCGDIMQIPPMYSAIKVNGQRLYKIARQGGEVERKPRAVSIKELRFIGRDGNGDVLLDVRCSAGTYIRTLCDDIGRALGCGGCMSSLRRTEVGGFSVKDAHGMDELIRAAEEGRMESLLLGVESIFPQLPRIVADAEQESRIRCGAPVTADAPDGRYLVYSSGGALLMLGEQRGGLLFTVKSFFEV